jgi:CheY-like chemotaxis protein
MLANLGELIRNSVGHRIDLEVKAAPGLCPVASDPTQLELAILNLAINARDAMPSGGRLTISADERRAQDGSRRVAITVADTGVGMPAEVVERALEPFFTTKGPGRGTGLGLSMAYGVANQAGGELTIDSVVGQGTTIIMLLPCSDLPEVAAPGEQGEARPAFGRGQGCNILLVDDDPEVRGTLADLLTEAGHRVRVAGGGEEALTMLGEEETDLLLLDFAMPGMNGAEVATRALDRQPTLKLLFITGYADSAAIDAAVDGRSRVLKKPVGAAELAEAIDSMLR